MKQALRAAFPLTIPVMLGYLFVGIAFGVLYQQAGYGWPWALLMSLTVYAGSMQFLAVTLFDGSFTLATVALLTLLVNVRHLFYGLSFVERFRGMGRAKPYLIFSLTDETYSLLCGVRTPQGVDPAKFCLCIAGLDQLYWIAGSVLGALVGAVLSFDTTGIDFAMTALFLVIATEQWMQTRRHLPCLLGGGMSLAALWLFGPDQMILPAMLAMTAALLAIRRPMEAALEEETE
ncbi:MAG: AzlC family ABC transporter permease [Eubacteriales bacterium]